MNGRCIGGKQITEPAGHYTQVLSAASVHGLERQRKVDFGIKRDIVERLHEAEVMAAEAEEDEDGEMDEALQPEQGDGHGLLDTEEDDEDIPVDDCAKVTAEEFRAALHLHKVTGHRSPLRLARALVISGASRSMVKAAKMVKCELCQEHAKVKTRRPANLPRP